MVLAVIQMNIENKKKKELRLNNKLKMQFFQKNLITVINSLYLYLVRNEL